MACIGDYTPMFHGIATSPAYCQISMPPANREPSAQYGQMKHRHDMHLHRRVVATDVCAHFSVHLLG